jgi:hypothetical protein
MVRASVACRGHGRHRPNAPRWRLSLRSRPLATPRSPHAPAPRADSSYGVIGPAPPDLREPDAVTEAAFAVRANTRLSSANPLPACPMRPGQYLDASHLKPSLARMIGDRRGGSTCGDTGRSSRGSAPASRGRQPARFPEWAQDQGALTRSRAPPSKRLPGRNLRRSLEPGRTAAPERESLALLPPGPDAVRMLPVRGTWLSTLRAQAQAP